MLGNPDDERFVSSMSAKPRRLKSGGWVRRKAKMADFRPRARVDNMFSVYTRGSSGEMACFFSVDFHSSSVHAPTVHGTTMIAQHRLPALQDSPAISSQYTVPVVRRVCSRSPERFCASWKNEPPRPSDRRQGSPSKSNANTVASPPADPATVVVAEATRLWP